MRAALHCVFIALSLFPAEQAVQDFAREYMLFIEANNYVTIRRLGAMACSVWLVSDLQH